MDREALVTAHFKQKEFMVSALFPEIAAKITLTENDIKNIFHLVATTIEPERVDSGVETHILQGKRSDELYEALMGSGIFPSSTSKHFFAKPFDCAIDFQKKVFKPNTSPRIVDITRSRVKTICAFYWILNKCPYSFGTMYYNYPGSDAALGFVHIDSITPGKPVGYHYTKNGGV